MVSAPGKMMLSGEYAVLEGAPAIVAAVSARARVSLGTPEREAPAEARATWELISAREEISAADARRLVVDVAELRDPTGAQKLGLGSSAAAAAATAALVPVLSGRGVDSRSAREAIFRDAFQGHRVIAPGGSGADVAAASFGGFVRFSPGNADSTLPRVESVSLPDELTLRVVWTGHAARTSELIAQIRALEEARPADFRARMDDLREAAGSLGRALPSDDLRATIIAVTHHHEAMRALGEAANAPIVDAGLSRAADLASRFGGAAKPSGAGGGDVAIAFFSDADAAHAFDQACGDHGLTLLDLTLGDEGPRVEREGSTESDC